MSNDDDVLLTSTDLRKRYGSRSAMWVWRQLKTDPTFPKPLYINTKRYWWLSALKRWELSKASEKEVA